MLSLAAKVPVPGWSVSPCLRFPAMQALGGYDDSSSWAPATHMGAWIMFPAPSFRTAQPVFAGILGMNLQTQALFLSLLLK